MKKNSLQNVLDVARQQLRDPKNAAAAIIGAVLLGFGVSKFTGVQNAKEQKAVKTELNDYLAKAAAYEDSIKVAEKFYFDLIKEHLLLGEKEHLEPVWNKLTDKEKEYVTQKISQVLKGKDLDKQNLLKEYLYHIDGPEVNLANVLKERPYLAVELYLSMLDAYEIPYNETDITIDNKYQKYAVWADSFDETHYARHVAEKEAKQRARKFYAARDSVQKLAQKDVAHGDVYPGHSR